MWRQRLWCVVLLVGPVPVIAQDARQYQWTIRAGKFDRPAGPVRVPVDVPKSLLDQNALVAVSLPSGATIPGQLTAPGLSRRSNNTDSATPAELTIIAPEMKAGQELATTISIVAGASDNKDQFRWVDDQGKSMALRFADRNVLRYMHEALDNSTPERRGETYKPYHHVYDPLGQGLVTKGPGGLFPHHRGLFFGFNRIEYGEQKTKADVWHCNHGEHQSHERIVRAEAGPVLGRHLLKIDWHGPDGRVFVHEERELSAYHVPGGSMIEFSSRLTSTVGKVRLDGDPQHAGFQFRASQEVPDKTANLTYYLRPDGKGEPGKFRNWDDKTRDPLTVDLPWLGLSFVLGEQRFTCLYLDRPENPKQSRFSERDYGRFGSYFEFDLDDDKPLQVHYRIWLQQGEMTVEQASSMANHFSNPLESTLVSIAKQN